MGYNDRTLQKLGKYKHLPGIQNKQKKYVGWRGDCKPVKARKTITQIYCYGQLKDRNVINDSKTSLLEYRFHEKTTEMMLADTESRSWALEPAGTGCVRHGAALPPPPEATPQPQRLGMDTPYTGVSVSASMLLSWCPCVHGAVPGASADVWVRVWALVSIEADLGAGGCVCLRMRHLVDLAT